MEHASDTMGLWCYGGVGNAITSGIPNDSSLHCDYLLALHIVISCDGKTGVYSRQRGRALLAAGRQWFAGGGPSLSRVGE